MTADQLIQQYDAGATTARELVEGVWDAVIQWNIGCPDQRIRCFIRGREQWSTDTETEAAEFTRDRVEEIRKVKGENSCQGADTDIFYRRLLGFIERGETKHLVGTTRDYCCSFRILARERAHLDTLCIGIKPEVLQ